MYNHIHVTEKLNVKSRYNGHKDDLEDGSEIHNASSQVNAGHHRLQYPSYRDSAAFHKDVRNCQTSSRLPLSIIIEEETSGVNDDFEERSLPEIIVRISKNIQIKPCLKPSAELYSNYFF